MDLLLARDSGEVSRLFRTSQRLLERRSDYYAELEKPSTAAWTPPIGSAGLWLQMQAA